MDSKNVTRCIRQVLFPVLKADGAFTKFAGRTAWRFDEQTITAPHRRPVGYDWHGLVGALLLAILAPSGKRGSNVTLPSPQNA
jgi:hypothetical protein